MIKSQIVAAVLTAQEGGVGWSSISASAEIWGWAGDDMRRLGHNLAWLARRYMARAY